MRRFTVPADVARRSRSSPCDSTNGRPTTCSPTSSASPGLGPRHASPGWRPPPAGRRPTVTVTRVDHAVRLGRRRHRRGLDRRASPTARARPAERRLLPDHRGARHVGHRGGRPRRAAGRPRTGPAASPCRSRSSGTIAMTITEIEPRVVLDRRYAEPVDLPAAIAELSVGARTIVPSELDTGCRDDLVEVDGVPVPIRVVAPVAELLAGAAVDGRAVWAGAVELAARDPPAGTPAGSGLQVDRDRARRTDVGGSRGAAPDRSPRSSRRAGSAARSGWRTALPVAGSCSAKASTNRGRQSSLTAPTSAHPSWSTAASTVGGSRRATDRPWSRCAGRRSARSRSPSWSSVIAALGCIALAIADRRRTPAPVSPRRPAGPASDPSNPGGRRIAAAAWIVGSVVLIGPEWAGPAAAGAAILLLIGRPRVAGVVSAAHARRDRHGDRRRSSSTSGRGPTPGGQPVSSGSTAGDCSPPSPSRSARSGAHRLDGG